MKVALVMQPINLISTKNQNGSIEIITYELARRLAKRCDVIVYAKKGHFQKELEYDQEVQYRRIPVVMDEWQSFVSSALDKLQKTSSLNALSKSVQRFLFFQNVKRPFSSSHWFYYNYALKVARSLQKEHCDIVHIHNFSQFIPIIRAFNPKIKIVLHMHCEWLTQLDRRMIESRIAHTNLIIGVSNFITNNFQSHFPQYAKRAQTLLNGAEIHPNPYRNNVIANEAQKLITVGRVSPEKGIHVLLDAFKQVLKSNPKTQLEIIGWIGALPIEYLVTMSDDQLTMRLSRFYGNENYFSHLKNKLSPIEENHVLFLGELPHKSIINYYQQATIYISASVCNEPGNMPVIEAMATGIPVVATRSGGTTESIVDGETGFLVERDDASAMAEAILRLLSDESLRNKMGKVSYERALKFFSWEHAVDHLFQMYEDIVAADVKQC
jgi:glycosyltransferase involved in cell wall biosynthesis